MPIIVACIAFVILLTKVIIPNGKYNAAVKLYDEGKYEEAIAAFKEMNGYKDSDEQIKKCNTAISDGKYNYGFWLQLIGYASSASSGSIRSSM